MQRAAEASSSLGCRIGDVLNPRFSAESNGLPTELRDASYDVGAADGRYDAATYAAAEAQGTACASTSGSRRTWSESDPDQPAPLEPDSEWQRQLLALFQRRRQLGMSRLTAAWHRALDAATFSKPARLGELKHWSATRRHSPLDETVLVVTDGAGQRHQFPMDKRFRVADVLAVCRPDKHNPAASTLASGTARRDGSDAAATLSRSICRSAAPPAPNQQRPFELPHRDVAPPGHAFFELKGRVLDSEAPMDSCAAQSEPQQAADVSELVSRTVALLSRWIVDSEGCPRLTQSLTAVPRMLYLFPPWAAAEAGSGSGRGVETSHTDASTTLVLPAAGRGGIATAGRAITDRSGSMPESPLVVGTALVSVDNFLECGGQVAVHPPATPTPSQQHGEQPERARSAVAAGASSPVALLRRCLH